MYCPKCGAKGVSRERCPDGNDTCENGHKYPSKYSVSSIEEFNHRRSGFALLVIILDGMTEPPNLTQEGLERLEKYMQAEAKRQLMEV